MSLHYLGKHAPRNWVFSVMLYTASKTTLRWLAISSTFINQFWHFFVDNKVILLGTVCKYYLSFSHFCVIPVRKQDQCYQLCGCCVICHCQDDGQLTQQSTAFATSCRQGLRSSLWLILSIVVFNVEQNFNQNFTFFSKRHAYKQPVMPKMCHFRLRHLAES